MTKLPLPQLIKDYEFYPCPEPVIAGLLAKVSFQGSIWEPCCGNGAIVKSLRNHGYTQILHTDLHDYREHGGLHDSIPGVNFLDTWVTVDNIVTAPPFGLKYQFVRRALAVAREKVAILLPSDMVFTDVGSVHKIKWKARLPVGFDYKGSCSWYIWDKTTTPYPDHYLKESSCERKDSYS